MIGDERAEAVARRLMGEAAWQREEFARVWHSLERIEFVRRLPCSVKGCRSRTRSENAHSFTGGMSRRADWNTIFPLCHEHHYMLHTIGVKTFQERHQTSIEDAVADTMLRWEEYVRKNGESGLTLEF